MPRVLAVPLALASLLLCAVVPGTAGAMPPAAVQHDGNKYTLTNGYVSVTLSTGSLLHNGAALVSLKGDFEGKGAYGEELLAGEGYTLQAVSTTGALYTSTDNDTRANAVTVKVVSSGPATAAIIVDGVSAGAAVETWSISLSSGNRSFQLDTKGSMGAARQGGRAQLVRHALSAVPISVYGFYPEDGVVQMMGAPKDKQYMPTGRALGRVYMLGGQLKYGGVNDTDRADGPQGSIDIVRTPGPAGQITVLTSNVGFGKSGYHEIVAGNLSGLDAWGSETAAGPTNASSCVGFKATNGCSATGSMDPAQDESCTDTVPCHAGACPSGYCLCAGGVRRNPVDCKVGSHQPFRCLVVCSAPDAAMTAPAVAAGASWATSSTIAPNNRNFPASGLVTTENLPSDDLAAIMTGIYASAPGCLCTFPNSPNCPGMEGKGKKLGQIATTVSRPTRGYSGTYNYFDPDNFFSMGALIFSAEPFLQEQARTVIERSGEWLCIGDVQKNNKCTYGQLPHHFVGTKPTFLALSGATQTGPNTFWTKSALMYAKNSGNLPWLKAYMPTLRASSSFCFDLIDKTTHMLLAPGSLMIDVFIRNNYAADSNAMMVGFLREFADAEDAVGNATGAASLRAKSSAMAVALNKYLWDTDHYVTQVDPGNMDCAKNHSCRDFVDYDSNLIAVAHNVSSPAQSKAVLHRIDTGIQGCTAMQHGGMQWTSEVWYGKHDTTGGNTGDSSSAMGRIAWFDAIARKNVGDVASFDSQLGVMQKDLLFYTFMHERYGCDGKQQFNRTEAYFEYPSTVAMLMRKIRYGIEIDFATVTVNPMLATPGPFSYHVGNVNVDYKPHGLTRIDVPHPAGVAKEYRLHGMATKGSYTVEVPAACAPSGLTATHATTASDSGVLAFMADGSCGHITVAFKGLGTPNYQELLARVLTLPAVAAAASLRNKTSFVPCAKPMDACNRDPKYPPACCNKLCKCSTGVIGSVCCKGPEDVGKVYTDEEFTAFRHR